MSILNRPSDGLVSVLVALVRSSVMIGTMPKSKLLDICSPKSLGDGKQDMATKTLSRWIELGLFVTTEKGEVKVADEYRSALRKFDASAAAIAKAVRQVVLDPENNKNFWSDEENRSADFSRAASWVLAQNAHAFVPTSYSQVEPKTLEQAGTPDVILFQNDTRWSGFVSWATFLGIGRSDSGKASGGFIADPTPWVREPALELVPQKKDVPIQEFLEGLATLIPVIDGGHYRQEVESKLRSEKWRAPGSGMVSTSLSRALLRLQAGGELRFADRSDSDSRINLVGRDGRTVQSVTHVMRGHSK
ncbi:protein DpdG [Allorhodopirellula solitaria]|uniref:Uncharacterized protein n=1 Tax=Allorhodopirellula solitaria TaxID=2527987 RepID=A0A5C5WPS6_9BACT|nr:protein DpdG [Allorhodopirellula solitaria]TWT52265.1 hypothetical protein CA85_50450 [Allorhodopirellula solitaria]